MIEAGPSVFGFDPSSNDSEIVCGSAVSCDRGSFTCNV